MKTFKDFIIEQVIDFEKYRKDRETQLKHQDVSDRKERQTQDFNKMMGDIEQTNRQLYSQYLEADIERLKRHAIFGFGDINDLLNFAEKDITKSLTDSSVQRKLYKVTQDYKLLSMLSDIVSIMKTLRDKTNGDFVSFMKDHPLLMRLTSLNRLLINARERFS